MIYVRGECCSRARTVVRSHCGGRHGDNTRGPTNVRLYDIAAFGICEICDNKPTRDLVVAEGKEIAGSIA